MVDIPHGYSLGPGLEGLAVDAESVGAGQRDEVGILPGAIAAGGPVPNGLCLLFQALGLQGAHPAVHREPWQLGDDAVAGRIVVGGEQFAVVVLHALGHLQDKLRRHTAAVSGHRGACLAHYVQDDVVVGTVLVVPMQEPVRRLEVDFHITHPQRAADAHLGIEKVGTGIAVVQAGVNDFHLFSVVCPKRLQREQPVLPYIMQQLFHHIAFRHKVKDVAKLTIFSQILWTARK